MYDGAGFTTYSTVNGLPNDWVTAVCERPDKPGALIAGTIAGGLCEFKDGRFVVTLLKLRGIDENTRLEQILEA